jgi:hypothetical protein
VGEGEFVMIGFLDRVGERKIQKGGRGQGGDRRKGDGSEGNTAFRKGSAERGSRGKVRRSSDRIGGDRDRGGALDEGKEPGVRRGKGSKPTEGSPRNPARIEVQDGKGGEVRAEGERIRKIGPPGGGIEEKNLLDPSATVPKG